MDDEHEDEGVDARVEVEDKDMGAGDDPADGDLDLPDGWDRGGADPGPVTEAFTRALKDHLRELDDLVESYERGEAECWVCKGARELTVIDAKEWARLKEVLVNAGVDDDLAAMGAGEAVEAEIRPCPVCQGDGSGEFRELEVEDGHAGEEWGEDWPEEGAVTP